MGLGFRSYRQVLQWQQQAGQTVANLAVHADENAGVNLLLRLSECYFSAEQQMEYL